MTNVYALMEFIKDMCRKHLVCDECPLRMGENSCYFEQTLPRDWDVYYIKEVVMKWYIDSIGEKHK